MQNPPANPDAATFRTARNSGLFKIERANMRVIAEHIYTLDDPQSFRRDPSNLQSDPRISEMMAIGLDRLVVLERTEQTTKSFTRSNWMAPPTSRAAAGMTWKQIRRWSKATLRRWASLR